MTKEDLIASAAALPVVPSSAAAEYEDKREQMVASINEYMLGRADIEELVGSINIEMMKDNHANHGLFIASMLSHFDAAVLVETINWVFKAYRSRQFHQNYWAAQLNAWHTTMKTSLSKETYDSVVPLYDWMTIHIPQFTALTDNEEVSVSSPKHQISSE